MAVDALIPPASMLIFDAGPEGISYGFAQSSSQGYVSITPSFASKLVIPTATNLFIA